MRLTHKLCAQHIGFTFKKHWIFQGVKTPLETGAEKILKERGIPVIDANDFLKKMDTKEKINIRVIGEYEAIKPRDRNHPDWKQRPCHQLTENNVLLEGFTQARVLTKSVAISNTLPESILELANTEHPPEIHQQVKKIILYSNVFDCEQQKLPRKKDPLRPAFVFPRILGITDVRRNILTSRKLFDLLEKTNSDIAKNRLITDDVEVTTSFEKDGDLFQFSSPSNLLITSTQPLGMMEYESKSTEQFDLPDMFPLVPKISIPKVNFYDHNDVYPIKDVSFKWYHPHTTVQFYNVTRVANTFDSPITEDQKLGRSLLHAFTVASAYAKSLYGKDVGLLPEPVTIQCIQTDGCIFHFGVLQLNNLDMNGSKGVKNIWYKSEPQRLFNNCNYISAKPFLEDYNPNVYNYLSAMYRNK